MELIIIISHSHINVECSLVFTLLLLLLHRLPLLLLLLLPLLLLLFLFKEQAIGLFPKEPRSLQFALHRSYDLIIAKKKIFLEKHCYSYNSGGCRVNSEKLQNKQRNKTETISRSNG
jgi:hypothetical protein